MTILRSIDRINSNIREVGICLTLHEDESLTQLFDALQNIWELWVQEVVARYAKTKHSQTIKAIPYAGLIAGMPSDLALQDIEERIEKLKPYIQAVRDNAKLKGCFVALDIIESELGHFAEYKKNPDIFQKELFDVADAAEYYFRRLQLQLADA